MYAVSDIEARLRAKGYNNTTNDEDVIIARCDNIALQQLPQQHTEQQPGDCSTSSSSSEASAKCCNSSEGCCVKTTVDTREEEGKEEIEKKEGEAVVFGRKVKFVPGTTATDYDIVFISSAENDDSPLLTNLMITFSKNTVRISSTRHTQHTHIHTYIVF